jgi:hypothetical protein
VLFGTVVFAMFAGFYFWWPKFTGTDAERDARGKLHFWLLFVGFHTTFLVQHWLGVEGMQRRYRRLPARGGLHLPQPGLHRGGVPAGHLDASVPLERVDHPEVRAAGRPSTTRGAGAVAGVGDLLPAAAAQLHLRCRGSARERSPPSTCTTRSFSPYSWWPLWLGLSAAICFLGLAVGWWVFAIGAFFAVPALIGWTFEYWKGAHHL